MLLVGEEEVCLAFLAIPSHLATLQDTVGFGSTRQVLCFGGSPYLILCLAGQGGGTDGLVLAFVIPGPWGHGSFPHGEQVRRG